MRYKWLLISLHYKALNITLIPEPSKCRGGESLIFTPDKIKAAFTLKIYVF
jgi:hypothetical protein